MNKFDFKLEPLFEHRRRLVEIKNKEFAEAMKRLGEEEERLKVLKEVYGKTSADLDNLKERGSQTIELGLYCAYLAQIKNSIAEQEIVIEKIRADYEEKRVRLVEASKEKKAVEIMKDKSYDTFVKEQERLEQKEHDEIASARFKVIE